MTENGYVCATCLCELSVTKTTRSYKRDGVAAEVVFLGRCPSCQGKADDEIRTLKQQVHVLQERLEKTGASTVPTEVQVQVET